jgi:hypothetical protein
MKNLKLHLIFACTVLAGSGLLFPSNLHAAEGCSNHIHGLTCPILSEKDSAANFITLFRHANDQSGAKFNQDHAIPDIKDFIASPGEKVKPGEIDYGMPIRLGGRIDPNGNLHGIGPEDIIYGGENFEPCGDGTNACGEFDYKLNVDDSLHGRRLTMGDIRKEAVGNEFQTIFGMDPLEAGLLGDTRADGPHANGMYPALPMGFSKSFQYCVPGSFPFHENCVDESKAPIDQPFDDVFVYDLTPFGKDLVVGTVYDPLTLQVDAKSRVVVDGVAGDVITDYYNQTAPYISPLAVFQKKSSKEKPNDFTLNFLGYTSFNLPRLNVNGPLPGASSPNASFQYGDLLMFSYFALMQPPDLYTEDGATKRDFFAYALNNPYLPVFANAIAVDAPPDGGNWLAVLYQNPLSPLDYNVLNPFGRPFVFGDGKHYKHTQILGFGKDANFESIEDKSEVKDWFAGKNVLPVGFWEEIPENKRGDTQYEKDNPSHQMRPTLLGLVPAGKVPGVLGQVAFTDRPKRDNTKSFLAVASNMQKGKEGLKGAIYLFEPKDPSKRLTLKSFPVTAGVYTGTPWYTTTQVMIPSEEIKIDPPEVGFVPYKIEAAFLNDDLCADMLITWRGKDTVKSSSSEKISYKGQAGRMFSNQFTIVYRINDKEHEGCQVSENGIRHISIGVPNAQVSAVAVGKFGLPRAAGPDLIVANANLEETSENSKKYSGYVYILEYELGVDRFPEYPSLNRKRLRAMYREFGEKDVPSQVGPTAITTDGKTIAVISGHPLTLPPVDCQDFQNQQNNPAVAGVHGALQSVLFAKSSEWINRVFQAAGIDFNFAPPFTETVGGKLVPVPSYCKPDREPVKDFSANGVLLNLPLWKDDLPINSAVPHSCLAFWALCQGNINSSIPFVGHVPCQVLYDQCQQDSPPAQGNNEPAEDEAGGDHARAREDEFIYLSNSGGIARFEDAIPAQVNIVQAQVNMGKVGVQNIQLPQVELPAQVQAQVQKDAQKSFSEQQTQRQESAARSIFGIKDYSSAEEGNIQLTSPEKVDQSVLNKISSSGEIDKKEKSDPEITLESDPGSYRYDIRLPDLKLHTTLAPSSVSPAEAAPANSPTYAMPLTFDDLFMPDLFYMPILAGRVRLSPDNYSINLIKLPRGREMPGKREITAIIPYEEKVPSDEGESEPKPDNEGGSTTVPGGSDDGTNGTQDYGQADSCRNGRMDAGEECDFQIDGTIMYSCPEGYTCTEECKCVPDDIPNYDHCGNAQMEQWLGEECEFGLDGNLEYPCLDEDSKPREGYTCTLPTVNPDGTKTGGCKCEPIPEEFIPTTETQPESVETSVPAEWECEVYCSGYPSDKIKEEYENLNKLYFREPTGRRDDYFCPMGQNVTARCVIRNAATLDGAIAPWMLVQENGLVLNDIGLITKENYPLQIVTKESPLRIAPLERPDGGQIKSSFTLPDLTSSGEGFEISGGITPMAATSVARTNAGKTIINNMLSITSSPFTMGSDFVEGDLALAADSSAGQETSRHVVHTTIMRSYIEPSDPTRESWPQGVDPTPFLIENRPSADAEYIRSVLETRIKESPGKRDRSIADGLSDDPGVYQMMIVQNQVKASSPQQDQQGASFSFSSTPVMFARGGGGCGQCAVSGNGKFEASAAIPLMLFLAFGTSGMIFARVRVKKNRNSKSRDSGLGIWDSENP